MRLGRRVGYCWWVFLEWKPQACWVGVFWQHRPARYHLLGVGDVRRDLHVWVCVLPMLPVHVIIPRYGGTMTLRLRCRLFGCVLGEFYVCDRCGVGLCAQEFVEAGWLTPLLAWAHWRGLRLRDFLLPSRCPGCGKWLSARHRWRNRRNYPDFCDVRCHDAWIPF